LGSNGTKICDVELVGEILLLSWWYSL